MTCISPFVCGAHEIEPSAKVWVGLLAEPLAKELLLLALPTKSAVGLFQQINALVSATRAFQPNEVQTVKALVRAVMVYGSKSCVTRIKPPTMTMSPMRVN